MVDLESLAVQMVSEIHAYGYGPSGEGEPCGVVSDGIDGSGLRIPGFRYRSGYARGLRCAEYAVPSGGRNHGSAQREAYGILSVFAVDRDGSARASEVASGGSRVGEGYRSGSGDFVAVLCRRRRLGGLDRSDGRSTPVFAVDRAVRLERVRGIVGKTGDRDGVRSSIGISGDDGIERTGIGAISDRARSVHVGNEGDDESRSGDRSGRDVRYDGRSGNGDGRGGDVSDVVAYGRFERIVALREREDLGPVSACERHRRSAYREGGNSARVVDAAGESDARSFRRGAVSVRADGQRGGDGVENDVRRSVRYGERFVGERDEHDLIAVSCGKVHRNVDGTAARNASGFGFDYVSGEFESDVLGRGNPYLRSVRTNVRAAQELYGSVSGNYGFSNRSERYGRAVSYRIDDGRRVVDHSVVQRGEVERGGEASVTVDGGRSGKAVSVPVRHFVFYARRGFAASYEAGERDRRHRSASDYGVAVKLEIRRRIGCHGVDEQRLYGRRGRVSGDVVGGDFDVGNAFRKRKARSGRAGRSRCRDRRKIRRLGNFVDVRFRAEARSGIGRRGPCHVDVLARSRRRRRDEREGRRGNGVHEERPLHDGGNEILRIAVLHPYDVGSFRGVRQRHDDRSR